MIVSAEKRKKQLDAEPAAFSSPVVEIRAFTIFPRVNSTHADSEDIFTLCARNLVSYLSYCVIQTYPETHRDQYLPELEQYINDLSKFLFSEMNSNIFILNAYSGTVSPDEKANILQQIKQFPKPVSYCSDEIHLVFQFLEQVICAINNPPANYWMFLYDLSVQWQMQLASNFPIRTKINTLEFWLFVFSRKFDLVKRNLQNALIWGAEFDEYYRDFLAQGFSDMSAKGRARKKFISNHPVPKTDVELLSTNDDLPGLSAPAVRRYHRIFLSVKGREFR